MQNYNKNTVLIFLHGDKKLILYLVDTFAKNGLANADPEVAVEAKVSVKVTKIQQIQRWSASEKKINNMKLRRG
jgi:hypothetical protein